MAEVKIVAHEFGPFYTNKSRVLILGSIPSPKSREQGFYYGHPRNRFWTVMSEVLGDAFPETVEERKTMLERNNIALWDVLARCEIKGADDNSIRNPEPNDLELIIRNADIKAVFATGKKAAELYQKYCRDKCGMDIICLPSTSPANCRCSYEMLINEYSKITEYL